MKKLLVFLLFVFTMQFTYGQQFHVASYNVRYANPTDEQRGNGWSRRCPVICDQIAYESFDLIGMQEVLKTQFDDLSDRLSQDYGCFGVGRNDGKMSGEYAPIFYKKDRFILLDSGCFWLSATPDKPSVGWDAKYPRICVWVQLRDRSTGNTLYFLNTHFDHKSATARRNSAELIVARLKKYGADDLATFVTGDLNVAYTNAAMAPLTGYLTGARESFSPMDQTPTFHNNGSSAAFIDHILYRNIDAPQSYRVLTDCYGVQKDGKDYYLSDHYPVTAVFSYMKP